MLPKCCHLYYNDLIFIFLLNPLFRSILVYFFFLDLGTLITTLRVKPPKEFFSIFFSFFEWISMIRSFFTYTFLFLHISLLLHYIRTQNTTTQQCGCQSFTVLKYITKTVFSYDLSCCVVAFVFKNICYPESNTTRYLSS